jgi:hypothetical protein
VVGATLLTIATLGAVSRAPNVAPRKKKPKGVQA